MKKAATMEKWTREGNSSSSNHHVKQVFGLLVTTLEISHTNSVLITSDYSSESHK